MQTTWTKAYLLQNQYIGGFKKGEWREQLSIPPVCTQDDWTQNKEKKLLEPIFLWHSKILPLDKSAFG
jgi:hypothetical protein